MKKILEQLKAVKKTKEDSGAANTLSFIFIIFFIMILLISFIDVGLYFNVKGEMQSAAENGARNVAIYGGTSGTLRNKMGGENPVEVTRSSINSKFQGGAKGIVSVTSVTCNPSRAKAGDKVSCEVIYKYKGVAGGFGVFNLASDKVKVEGSSVSEVSIK